MQESEKIECGYYFYQDPIFSDDPDSEERLVINSAVDRPKWYKTSLVCRKCDLFDAYQRKLSESITPDDARSANVAAAFTFLRKYCPLRNSKSQYSLKQVISQESVTTFI